MNLGDLPQWIMAISAISSVAFAYVANRLAKASQIQSADAAARSEEARRESLLARQQHEKQLLEFQQSNANLERRLKVAGVCAWWAKRESFGQETWGVVISNKGTSAGMHHEVVVYTESRWDKYPLHLDVLPPGQYFVESIADRKWGLPESLDSADTYAPIIRSGTHSIKQILFKDSLGDPWCWDPVTGIHEAKSAH